MTPEQIEVVVSAVREKLAGSQTASFAIEDGFNVRRTRCNACGQPSTEVLDKNGTQTLTVEINGGAQDIDISKLEGE